MQIDAAARAKTHRRHGSILVFCICCIALNLFGAWGAGSLHIPVFLDSLGTVLAAVICGYIPGIAVGYITNLVNSVSDGINAYYAVINAMLAVLAAFFYHRGGFRKPQKIVLVIISFALVGGGLGSVITWFLFGGGFGEGISAPLAHRLFENTDFSVFFSQLCADLLIDLLDKTIIVLLAVLILRVLPDRIRERLELCIWQQTPMDREERSTVSKSSVRVASLRVKVVVLLSVALLIVAIVTTCISFVLFHRYNLEQERTLGTTLAEITAAQIDPERVETYLKEGADAEGGMEMKQRLAEIRESHSDIAYVSVCQIREDGCHVVLAPDTGDMPGFAAGEVVPFDDAVSPYVPALLEGKRIGPVVSNRARGWMLTAYAPVYARDGTCTCYAVIDLSMAELFSAERTLLTKSASLFLGFFILILALGLWLAEYSVILPVNAMARAASNFVLSSEESRGEGVEAIRDLKIHTGDEIESLYHDLTKTSEDMARYVGDLNEKNETINRMQNNLIAVLADMVESRDKHTGDHIKKTADYSRIILQELRREGLFPGVITDDYMKMVLNSAPLHDVGKINVPDALLNKPGKLTDEEFRSMQKHTLAGQEILHRAVDAMSEREYFKEAENLALYHHERWDGKGYPSGLKGEEIPLSARIMAVADVFDALVSKRSYKEGLSVETALNIIREGIGTHFDPRVAEAFLRAEDEVRQVVEQHGDVHREGGKT